MSKKEKLRLRLLAKPTDFTWSELERVLFDLGYEPKKTGKTGGSRRKFVHETAPLISLHKPHPGNILKQYQIEQIISTLQEGGLL